MKCESASRHFQPGEDPSRSLLRDCEIFGEPSFEALGHSHSGQNIKTFLDVLPILLAAKYYCFPQIVTVLHSQEQLQSN